MSKLVVVSLPPFKLNPLYYVICIMYFVVGLYSVVFVMPVAGLLQQARLYSVFCILYSVVGLYSVVVAASSWLLQQPLYSDHAPPPRHPDPP